MLLVKKILCKVNKVHHNKTSKICASHNHNSDNAQSQWRHYASLQHYLELVDIKCTRSTFLLSVFYVQHLCSAAKNSFPSFLAKPFRLYERSFPRLPFDAPLACAHVIDVTKPYHQNSPIKMADIVVTVLFNYCLDLLNAFLNFNRHPKFTFTRTEMADTGRRVFSVERSGLTVTVSYVPPQKIGPAEWFR